MKGILVFALALCSIFGNAQDFGGFPPSMRWKQFDNDTVRLIFSPGVEWQAKRIQSLILRAAADTPFALGPRLQKINVLLHSRTTQANGYVALAPFRSEFYLIPSTNTYEFGNQPWYESLAIHEYRHVQQYNNFRNGASRALFYLFGEQGLALANALSVPDWFFEGDAVHSETALTSQGRGRLSYFLSGYHSLWLDKKNYSWLKLRNGSLKDYVPDPYQLGYLLSNYGYLKYGDEFWKHVTHDASSFRGLFYPFQSAVKRYSGKTYKQFRNEALDFYRKRIDSMSTQPHSATVRGTVSNYYYPQFAGADSLVYLKSAYDQLASFYLQTSQTTRKIALREISSEEWFSYRNGKIVYTAYSPDARWSLVDYSDIVVLDVKTGKQTRITRKQRFYNPDLSPGADRLAVIRMNDSLRTQIELMPIEGGKPSQVFQATEGSLFGNLRFADENHLLATIRSEDSKMSLQLLDLRAGTWRELLPYSDHIISNPTVRGDTVFFTANYRSNDDLYALRMTDGKIWQLSQGVTGFYFPTTDGNSLAYSSFTSRGLQLKKFLLTDALWKELPPGALRQRPEFYPVAAPSSIMDTRTERFAAKRYSRSTQLLRFHSWAPDYTDPEFTFSLYSNNILNTFSTELFYRYNQNEVSHTLGWNASYGGWFPKINTGVEYTFHRRLRTPTSTILLDQAEARVGFNIPLSFSKGTSYKFLNVGSDFHVNRLMPQGLFKDSLRSLNHTYLSHFITWGHYRPQARQHIFPKLGYSLYGSYRHQLSQFGYQSNGTAQIYLPSFGNHSIVLQGSFQQTDTANTVFSNRYAGARGYDEYFFSRMWRVGANYHFPIWYADLGFASIVYLQRLRGNVFYDYSRVYNNRKTQFANLRSAGFETYFDTKWWNQLPVSFGIRVSHLLDEGFSSRDRRGSNWVEFILQLDLIPGN